MASNAEHSPSTNPRFLWVVRHGERVDNVDREWRAKGAHPQSHWDDPPLSLRGLIQAAEVGQRISTESAQTPVHFLLCSPFSRCLQTARQILAKMSENGCPLPIVLIEPGFCESLNACQKPPGFPTMEEIRQSYPELPIDWTFSPYITADKLPKEEKTNFCCFRRIIGTLQATLEKLSGNLLIVSHGSPITAIHFGLTEQLEYPGQCTVSHYRIGQACIGDENTFGQESSAALFPRIGKSIVIRAVPPKSRQLAKLNNKSDELGPTKRRNTMPTGNLAKFRLKREESSVKRYEKLALCLTRLAEMAQSRTDLGAVECLAVGDDSHLADKRDLHDVLHI